MRTGCRWSPSSGLRRREDAASQRRTFEKSVERYLTLNADTKVIAWLVHGRLGPRSPCRMHHSLRIRVRTAGVLVAAGGTGKEVEHHALQVPLALRPQPPPAGQ